METTIAGERIDIDSHTLASLADMAAEKGTDLKQLIEDTLAQLAEDYEDACTYTRLMSDCPEGQQPAPPQERAEFLDWLTA